MKKPIVQEVYTDNGSLSHYALIDVDTGEKLWSEDPDECRAMGYPVIDGRRYTCTDTRGKEACPYSEKTYESCLVLRKCEFAEPQLSPEKKQSIFTIKTFEYKATLGDYEAKIYVVNGSFFYIDDGEMSPTYGKWYCGYPGTPESYLIEDKNIIVALSEKVSEITIKAIDQEKEKGPENE